MQWSSSHSPHDTVEKGPGEMRGRGAGGRNKADEASRRSHLVGHGLHNTCFPAPETFQESEVVDPNHCPGSASCGTRMCCLDRVYSRIRSRRRSSLATLLI